MLLVEFKGADQNKPDHRVCINPLAVHYIEQAEKFVVVHLERGGTIRTVNLSEPFADIVAKINTGVDVAGASFVASLMTAKSITTWEMKIRKMLLDALWARVEKQVVEVVDREMQKALLKLALVDPEETEPEDLTKKPAGGKRKTA